MVANPQLTHARRTAKPRDPLAYLKGREPAYEIEWEAVDSAPRGPTLDEQFGLDPEDRVALGLSPGTRPARPEREDAHEALRKLHR